VISPVRKMKSEKITIYHNPRCSKSRDSVCILEEYEANAEVVHYLETPPTQKLLKELLKKLGMKAEEIVRKSEPLYIQKFAGKKISSAEWIRILSKNPVLIERPIIVKGNKAFLGRPPERIKELLGKL
jgi:arsenate reductase (glutaredoxin)